MAILNRDFIKWVALAFLIAAPLGCYAMEQWLQNFAYRIDIDLLSFTLPALAALFIALLTISNQALKAALANPVDSLRSE